MKANNDNSQDFSPIVDGLEYAQKSSKNPANSGKDIENDAVDAAFYASLQNEAMQQWWLLTQQLQKVFGLETYHAADLAIKFITNRTLQNGLLRGFADDALLSSVEAAVLSLGEQEVSPDMFDVK